MPSKDINTSGNQLSGASKGKGDDRKARLSQALRDNLKRRKAQTRARRTDKSSAMSAQSPRPPAPSPTKEG